MSPADKSARVKRIAAGLGFERVGVAPAAPSDRAAYVSRWLASGRAGSMTYLHRNRDIRTDPGRILDGARSVIVTALNYHQTAPPRPAGGPIRGRVAMYAWGDDYHDVVKKKLHALADAMHAEIDETFQTRCCVDTAPLLEREIAAAAGIGWIGKNTLVMHQDLGSYFFLGEIVTTLDLAPDQPVADHCGTCTRCLEACPTDAFPAPYEMDASRCISYLTIEHRDEIDPALQGLMGDWVFGCDICQQVCPHNRDAPEASHFSIRHPAPHPDLDEILNWSIEDYRRTLRGSAMKRAKPEMLHRNATIARKNAV